MKAKSLIGSHISVTACGKYPPTTPATLFPMICDDLLIMLPKVPEDFRAAGISGLSLPGDVPAVGDSAALS
jgi:hypothetical protein